MAMTVSEILQQAEWLSPMEQLELLNALAERVCQTAAAASANAGKLGDMWFNLYDVKELPLHQTVTRLIRVYNGGKG